MRSQPGEKNPAAKLLGFDTLKERDKAIADDWEKEGRPYIYEFSPRWDLSAKKIGAIITKYRKANNIPQQYGVKKKPIEYRKQSTHPIGGTVKYGNHSRVKINRDTPEYRAKTIRRLEVFADMPIKTARDMYIALKNYGNVLDSKQEEKAREYYLEMAIG